MSENYLAPRLPKFRIWDNEFQKFLDNGAGTHCHSNLMIDPFTGRLIDFIGNYVDDVYTRHECEDSWLEFGEKKSGRMVKLGDKTIDIPEMEKKFPKYVLEQFTGLTDKNGIEIYEGDIVAYDGRWDEAGLPLPPNHEPYEIVWFGGGLWSFRVNREKYLSVFKRGDKLGVGHTDCAVLGNIHQNPELIKESPVS